MISGWQACRLKTDYEKILKKCTITSVTGICFLLAAYMTVTQIVRYLENNDTSRVGYKTFNESPQDRYPDFTLCLATSQTDIGIEQNPGLVYSYFDETEFYLEPGIFGLSRADYGQLLKGKIVSNWHGGMYGGRMVDIDIRNVSDMDVRRLTIKPDEIFSTIEFSARHENDSVFWSELGEDAGAFGKIVVRTPLQLSFQDPETICITRKYEEPPLTHRLTDLLYILQEKLKKFNEFVMLRFYVHHPGQLIRSFDKPAYETILGDFEWERNLLTLAISQVSVLRRRKDANSPCNPDLDDEDFFIRKTIISRVGCIPIYWKFLLDEKIDVRECKSGTDLETVYYHTTNLREIFSTLLPPCDDMQVGVSVDHNRRYGSRLLGIHLTYTGNTYQEILKEREFSFETFWSSVGGFVGIFMGYSLLQIPEFIGLVLIWIKNLYGNYKHGSHK